jgi:hypothetical protein
VIRTEIRTLLRETTSASSFWDDATLLYLFNACIDLRVMQLAMLDEGWVTDQVYTSLVSGQREYTLPEGAGRVKQVTLKYTLGSAQIERDLVRDDQWGTDMAHGIGATSITNYQPTYQLSANLILLEPKPMFALTDALQIDLEAAPARISADADKIDLRFPDVMETLLVYDTVVLALSQENSQSNQPENYVNAMQSFQQQYEATFMEYASDRTEGLTFGRPYRQGA